MPSTAGPNGPDHISQLTYDLAGQKLTELRGVGSSIAITYATYGYGLDGEVATIKDANGNLTSNSYDPAVHCGARERGRVRRIAGVRLRPVDPESTLDPGIGDTILN